MFATVLLNRGRYGEAIEHIDAALSMDHSSLFFRSYRAQVLFYARRFEEALRESEEILEENSEFAMGLMQYGAAMSLLGRHTEALPLLERSYTRLPIATIKAGIAYSQWGLGRHEDARRTVEEMLQMPRDGSCTPTMIAMGLAVIGEHERAIQWLQKAFTEHDTTLPLISQMPPVDPLRSDPRVVKVFERLYAE